jgi:hypothetical protein
MLCCAAERLTRQLERDNAAAYLHASTASAALSATYVTTKAASLKAACHTCAKQTDNYITQSAARSGPGGRQNWTCKDTAVNKVASCPMTPALVRELLLNWRPRNYVDSAEPFCSQVYIDTYVAVSVGITSSYHQGDSVAA